MRNSKSDDAGFEPACVAISFRLEVPPLGGTENFNPDLRNQRISDSKKFLLVLVLPLIKVFTSHDKKKKYFKNTGKKSAKG